MNSMCRLPALVDLIVKGVKMKEQYHKKGGKITRGSGGQHEGSRRRGGEGRESREAHVVQSLSWVRLFATPWTAPRQAPLPVGFLRQEYWSGYPFPSRGDLPNLGTKLGSPSLQAVSLGIYLKGSKINKVAWEKFKKAKLSPGTLKFL